MIRLISQIKCIFRNMVEALCKYFDVAMLNNPCFKSKAVFGPVKSRRLGYSLGINTMKCKMCTYDCVYCHIGQTPCRSTCRDSCLGSYELYCVVRRKLDLLKEQNIPVDYITFMPNGEPTLNSNLAQDISLLREFGYKIAVFTNSSLLWNDRVQEDLLFADYVSIKIDTVDGEIWKTMNVPHSRLRFQNILHGIKRFAKTYQGILVTETMLVKDINDSFRDIENIGAFLKNIRRNKSYFTIPTRPPVKPSVFPPDRKVLNQLSKFIAEQIPDSEMLFEPEEEIFYGAGSLEDELIGVLSAHPMREESVNNFITYKGGKRQVLQQMMEKNMISKSTFEGKRFYIHTNPVENGYD